MIVLRCAMNAARLQSLINGRNITRWSSYAAAYRQATEQRYYTTVLLGCDGRFWVPSTPRLARQLMAAGYEAAQTSCVDLTAEGESEVVMCDFLHG